MTALGFYHCSVKSVGRAKGRSVVAAAAYRHGERLHDEITGQTFDYRARGGVVESFILAPDHAPSWAHDCERLWNEAERAEGRANGRLATEIEIALPHELNHEQRKELLRDHFAPIVDRYGVAVDIAIHEPGEGRDHRNVHAHVLVTHRVLDEDGFGELSNARMVQKNGRKPETIYGIAANSNDVSDLRKGWEQTLNRAYERAGLDIRADHRSHADRGWAEQATIHLGSAAAEMERRQPGSSERAAINRDIAARNAERQRIAALEAEERKLGAQIIDLKADRAMQEAREAAKGRYDMTGPTPPPAARGPSPGRYDDLRAAEPKPEVVRAFESSASRTTEPAAPIWERDADNADWEAKLGDAAIANAEAQKAGQRPDSDKTRAAAGTTADRDDNRGTLAEFWDELRAWKTDAQPVRADGIEAERGAGNTDAPADRAADQMFDAIEDTLGLGSKAAGGVTSRLATAVGKILGGILEIFSGGTKLTPMQAELAARANEELAEAREQIAVLQEKESAPDPQIFERDRPPPTEEMENQTGHRDRSGDREREREREWPEPGGQGLRRAEQAPDDAGSDQNDV